MSESGSISNRGYQYALVFLFCDSRWVGAWARKCLCKAVLDETVSRQDLAERHMHTNMAGAAPVR